MDAKQEAIADANAHLSNVGLPTYEELVGVIELLYATRHPFAPKEEGGLGLAYTGENLTSEAWEIRALVADGAARAILAKAKGE